MFYATIFAQNNIVSISGVVTDSLKNSIVNATIIAKSKKENTKIKYAISNSSGYYKLQLIRGVAYELSISHLSYNPIKKQVLFLEDNSNYRVRLNLKNKNLDEVIINYKYQPIKKNKDTITYSLNSFTNGNEFKMKDVLNKLPGIKTVENTIKVQGKTVTKLLIEGKPFFDGSTKLAIENIPADVMDKIEIISNYKESELLRNLADNEDLALNVVLKEDKKDFVFGDIEAGTGFDRFYSFHTALFKYSLKSNINFIGDINNFNNSSINFSDLSRLVGGSSNLFDRSNFSSNLLSFASNNKNRFKSLTRFSALNFQHEFNENVNITGYVIYSNNDIVNKSLSAREYLIDDEHILEKRNDIRDTNNNSGIVNLKLDYNPSAGQKWIYNFNYLFNNSGVNQESLSTLENTNQFFTDANGHNNSFSQNLEGYLKLNDKHTMGVAFRHSVTNSKSTNNWSSNNSFLEGFLPVIQTTDYHIQQKNDIQAQRLNLIVKDYWLTSRYYHLFYSVGLNYKKARIKSDLYQLIPDDTVISFSEFSNNTSLTLSDLNFGLGLKSQLGKIELIFEAKPHYFSFNRGQINDTNLFIEPKFRLNYQIDDDIDLDFDYSFRNRYLNDLSYLENIRITGFNSAIQGNPNLLDERFHNWGLYYSNYKNIDKYSLDVSLDYSINNPVKNNSIKQNGINQLNIPVILNLPEESLGFNTDFGLIFNKSSLDFQVTLDWLKTNQVINEEVNVTNSFEYDLSSKWLLKLNKRTQLSLRYNHSGYRVKFDEESVSTEDKISLNFDARFLKNFIFKTNLSTHFVNDFSDNTQNYTLQNLSLGYYKPNSKFSYGIEFKNIFNNGVVVRNSFNNNLLMSRQVFTLPRIFLFELKYKF
ncbi:carboxypeptidase regulatory-like domain-containing protein [uncultured Tenacibaculum sp.]|uniref:carboxypeptidase regulatory-like domain-containing protein n=1 Tax=uncultured Tenacibaculum sp. TaxID=174713 RepID=UPI002621EEC6|nr:carboxypeptidase regulatory-like domain-containing protein [uncultured Tenacibaculum sp.]